VAVINSIERAIAVTFFILMFSSLEIESQAAVDPSHEDSTRAGNGLIFARNSSGESVARANEGVLASWWYGDHYEPRSDD
jgi:hypothetical protein